MRMVIVGRSIANENRFWEPKDMLATDWSIVAINVGLAVGVIIAGLLIHAFVFIAVRRMAARGHNLLEESITRHCATPLRLIFPLLALDVVMPSLKIHVAVDDLIQHVIALLLIAGVAWLIIRVMLVAEDMLVERFRLDVPGDLRARRVRTQFEVFRRVAAVAVFVIAFGIALTTFQWASTLGSTVLASAGIVGLAGSLTARPTIENLVAGLQIALTEPFRLEDVVIANGEWGQIEEITTTYVVLRTWDLRRLILPISYFIQTPFQNWTLKTTDLMAYVYLYLDYTMPIEPLRLELTRILTNSHLWDQKVNVLQISDASEHAIQVRALMSAADSGTAWDLRCEVREKLVAFVQKNYPQCLPRNRNDLLEIQARVVPADGNARSLSMTGEPHP
jgi:small-conductance mechanosensitive channel